MAVTQMVCGPDGASGVTYATLGGQEIQCGVDSSGNTLMVQVATWSPDAPMDGGEAVGFDIGAAVLLVLASAWMFKVLGRQVRGGDEGA